MTALAVAAFTITLVPAVGTAAPTDQGDEVEVSSNLASGDPAVVTLTPSRYADTRPGASTFDGQFQGEGRRGALTEYKIQIAGRGGVPANATGVVVYLTAVFPDGLGFLTTHPCVTPRPETSSVNYTAGVTVGNEIVSALAADGSLCVFTFAGTDLTVDVVGYLPPTNAITPIVPGRVLETREGAPTVDGISEGIGRTAPNTRTTVKVTGRAGVPADAEAVVVNVGAVDPTDTGFVEVDTCDGATPPTSSALNYVPGVNRANELISAVNAAGEICVYTQHDLDLIVDVVAYVPAGTNYVSIPRKRFLETRPGAPTFDGANQGEGKLAADSQYTLQIAGRGGVPANAVAAIINVTSVGAEGIGFITVHPCVDPRPNAASLNYVANVNGANEIIAGLSASGQICLYTFGPTHLLVDVAGYLTPTADLSITTTDAPDPIAAGSNLTYTLDVANAGPQTARNVVVTDTLPAGVTLVSTAGCTNGAAAVPTCNLGDIAAGGSKQYTITVTVDNTTSGTLVNSASVASETTDFDLSNNTTTASTQVTTARATDDAFTGVGNTVLEVGVAPPGAAPAVRLAGNVLANDAGAGPITVTANDTTSARGGTVTMAADGTFTYVPPAGATGVDTFNYTMSDDGGVVSVDVGKVSITLNDIVWYVDNTSAAATKTGTSAAPFDTLAAAQAPSGPNSTIFVYAGNGTDSGYDQGIMLDAGQKLLGETVGLTVGGHALVAPGARPKISASGTSNAVVVGAGGTVQGIDASISGAGAALRSTGAAATITDVDVTANSEGIVLDGASGTFNFDDVNVTSSGGTSLRVSGGTPNVAFGNGSITQTGNAAAIDISGHTGTFTFASTSTLNATNGTGLQFSNADGTYDFDGGVTLNGGDAGIDVLDGSGGTFTFPATTTITNPSGEAVKIDDFTAGGRFDFEGSITANNARLLDVANTAASSQVNFLTTGGNALMSTDAFDHTVVIFSVDGDLTMTTPMTFTRPEFSSIFATDGAGTWTFNDLTIVDQQGLGNGAVDVFGNTGTLNFHNLDVSTSSAGTGNEVSGILAGGNNIMNVTGTSMIDANGGTAVNMIGVTSIDMTFASLRSRNNTDAQIGGGNDGVVLSDIGGGTFTVTGTTTVEMSGGVGIFTTNFGAAASFASIAIDGTDDQGIIAGSPFSNTGSLTVGGGTINNTGNQAAIQLGNVGVTQDSSGGTVEINNVTITNFANDTVEVNDTTVSGTGNIAAGFVCDATGVNTGSISFNGGANSCP